MPSSSLLRFTIIALTLGSASLHAQTTYQELTGFDLLPAGVNGSGIIFGLVEADQSPANPNSVAYRSNRAGITFTYQDLGTGGVSYTTSSHANTVMARYANLATGSTNVINTEAMYFYNQFLNLGISGYPTPALNQPGSDVINMSWIFGALGSSWDAVDRRTDYLTSQWNKVVVAGVSRDPNNDLAAPASAYNVIAVAELNDAYTAPRRTNLGPTEGPNPGRANPHLLAPGTTTSNSETNNSRPSWAAPVVSAAAAVILQTARGDAEYSAADDARLVKSILLTGAVKLPGWEAAASTKVLDVNQGAGIVNIANSYAVLTGGRTIASNSSAYGTTGWDVRSVTRSGGPSGNPVATWFFDIPDAGYFDLGFELSATLAWNREVASNFGSATLRNLHLELFAVNGETFQLGESIYKSDSNIDNLQYIFHVFGADETGRYALVVTGEGFSMNETETFALSWNAVAIPEPATVATILGILCCTTLLLRRKR